MLVGPPPMSDVARRWHAVWESGAGAALDGAAALLAADLSGFSSDRLDVSIPHRNRDHRVDGVLLHRRRTMPPVMGAGIPRVRAPHAVLSAAAWAVSDRQAALLLCMVVQQRLVRPADLLATWSSVVRTRRRGLIGAVVGDLCDGVHSLGELDFARLCRERALPEPTRQLVRTLPGGRVYLDVAWEDVGLTVEVDGGHHSIALNPVDDALRQNDVMIDGDLVLRIPVIGLRVAPDRFMDQVVRAHRSRTARAA